MQPVEPQAFLVAHLPVVESVISQIARRQRVRGDDLAEFRSLAYLKLVDRDYEAVRRFRGTSSFHTYLTVVLRRVLLDHRNRQWGRWRPSARARRRGALAVRLERLVTRDGLSVQEALASLSAESNLASCAGFANALEQRRHPRDSRAVLDDPAPPEPVDPSPDPEARAAALELRQRSRPLQRIVGDALHALDSEDHLIVTMRFRDGRSVPDIAGSLGMDAKLLYRRIHQILHRLQRRLSQDRSFGQLAREMARDSWADHAGAGDLGWWRSTDAETAGWPAAPGVH